jgi:hypothetical protein
MATDVNISNATAGGYTLVSGGKITTNILEVQTANIVDGAITSAKIGTAEITSAKIGYAEIESLNIKNSNITTSKILDDNVTITVFSVASSANPTVTITLPANASIFVMGTLHCTFANTAYLRVTASPTGAHLLSTWQHLGSNNIGTMTFGTSNYTYAGDYTFKLEDSNVNNYGNIIVFARMK